MRVKRSPLPWSGAVATVALLTVVAACGTSPALSGRQAQGSEPGSRSTSAGARATSGTPTPPPPPPVVMTPSVADQTTKVHVDTLVSVKASQGTLDKVKVSYVGQDAKGDKVSGTVSGALTQDKSAWQATERLEPSSTYTVAMTGTNASDSATTKTTSTFKTENLTLAQQTYPTLYPLKGSEVGIGMPISLNFDVPVKDKAEIQKHLQVTTSPSQKGSWHWFSDTQVRWRPASYWKPGTKVSVVADVNSVNAGGGVYGQNSTSTSFTVGRSMIVKVNLASDVAHVYRNGKMVRTIYVSGGKAGWQSRSGIKVIMAKEYNKVMTNEMIGAPESYRLTSLYAMRITNSGEFLHSAPWNSGNFGVRNTSHGCTGMSNADAGWLIQNSLIGDPVVTTGTGRYMELDNGYGDWNVSFKQYAKGSAL
jgi:lipoprotein-anchoring transpeptidase ErfK/SrfK